MFVASAIGPDLTDLRPLKPPVCRRPEVGDCFPVYLDLLDRFLAHDPAASGQPDPTVTHALAVCSAYTYAEVVGFGDRPDTVARMMARLGLPKVRVLMVAERIDAAFVVSSGFLLQSDDGRVVILAYRGTEPFNVASWMTDADLHNGPMTIRVGGQDYDVHPGFYRNVRATRSPLIEALDRARRGASIIDGEPVGNPMEALFLAGHSLGAAMAALVGILLLNDPAYADLAGHLRAVYGYGQPMIGSQSLADTMASTGQDARFLRFVYGRDVVPSLPPRGLGDYAHFGQQFEKSSDGGYEAARTTRQASFFAIPIAPLQFLAHRLPVLRHVPFPYSLDDHLPLNYVDWLAPDGYASEYGDYPAHLDAGST